MSYAHSSPVGFACFWLYLRAFHQGNSSVQDVYRIGETVRFLNTHELCKVPPGEAVFHEPKQGTLESWRAC